MERKCKTCDKVVGKGKSYCNDLCKPSSHYNRHIVNQNNRTCKTCGILVGKSKSYCSKKCQPGYHKMLEKNKFRTAEWRNKNLDYHKKYDISRRPKRYCLDCNVEIPKGRYRCDTHWIQRIKEQRKQHQRKAVRKRRNNNPLFKLQSNIRSALYSSLKKMDVRKAKKTFEALGYTPQELKEHLEKHFDKGMTWDNWTINGWHIDHTKPQSSFSFQSLDDPEFKECWSLDNLRPMWAEKNRKKSNKY